MTPPQTEPAAALVRRPVMTLPDIDLTRLDGTTTALTPEAPELVTAVEHALAAPPSGSCAA